jgi:hypothetical protein
MPVYVTSTPGEPVLLSMTLAPDDASSGRVYVDGPR